MSWKLSLVLIVLLFAQPKQAEGSKSIKNAENLSSPGIRLVNSPIFAQSESNQDVESIILILGLTDEQIAEIFQVDRQYMPQLEELRPSVENVRGELEALIRSEDASEAEVREKYGELAILDQQLSDLRFEWRMAIREILSPEQRLPYEQYIDQRVSESAL